LQFNVLLSDFSFCSVCHNRCTLLVPTFWHCKCLHVLCCFDFTHISVCMCRYRVTMFARWKLRGMYATCMWLVQLLLMLSKQDPLFSYVPEFYVETLVCAQSAPCHWVLPYYDLSKYLTSMGSDHASIFIAKWLGLMDPPYT
jgi:hypothetical protein